jgi:PAS domain S-box-containing protein
MPNVSTLSAAALADLLDEVTKLTGIGFLDHDHRTDEIFWSPGMRRHFGWGPNEPVTLGEIIAQVVPEDRPAIAAAVARAHDPTGDGRYDVVHRVRRRNDGELRWLATRSQTFFEDGRPVRTIGAVTDVTARQFFASPGTDQGTAARLWDILDRSLNEIYVFDTISLRFHYANAGALRNLGYSQEAISTMTPLDLKPSFTEATFRAVIEPLLKGTVAQLAFETVHRRADGTTYPVDVRLQVMESEGSRVFLAVINDITERRATEEARRLAETAMTTARNPMAIAETDGGLVWVNRALLEHWGYDDATELLGRGRGTLVEVAQAQAAFAIVVRDGEWEGDLTAVRRDGSRFMVQCNATVMRDPRGSPTHLMTSFIDITERKRAEAAMRASLEEKEALLKEVHHRVKNNLQVVTSLLALQAQREHRPEVLTALRETQGRVRAMALLHETLYRSPSLSRVSLASYLEAIGAQLARSYLTEAAPRLTVQVDDVALPIDQAMPCGLLVSELVTNAFKHAFGAGAGGSIVVAATRDGEAVVLSVSDDGVGLPAEVDLTTTPSLGLRLVRRLTDQLNGELTIERARGTAITVRFEVAPNPEPVEIRS